MFFHALTLFCRVPVMLFEHEAAMGSVYNVMQIMQGSFKYFQVQTHVQTARESPDLNMDFRSFDNGCKQLYE